MEGLQRETGAVKGILGVEKTSTHGEYGEQVKSEGLECGIPRWKGHEGGSSGKDIHIPDYGETVDNMSIYCHFSFDRPVVAHHVARLEGASGRYKSSRGRGERPRAKNTIAFLAERCVFW